MGEPYGPLVLSTLNVLDRNQHFTFIPTTSLNISGTGFFIQSRCDDILVFDCEGNTIYNNTNKHNNDMFFLRLLIIIEESQYAEGTTILNYELNEQPNQQFNLEIVVSSIKIYPVVRNIHRDV